MPVTELIATYGVESVGMAARVRGIAAGDFTRSVAWRTSSFLARALLVETTSDALIFEDGLSYRECLEVLDSLKECEEHGIAVITDRTFDAYVMSAQTFVEERSRVGSAIKHGDPQLDHAFHEFERVVAKWMVRPLRSKQMRDAFFMASMRWSANFSVPGAGKTASVLGSYCFLREKGIVERVVVVCPKSAFASWRDEWVSCFGGRIPLSCFSLGDRDTARLSKEQRRRAVELDSGRYNLMVFNYESLGAYVRELGALAHEKTLLVFDEVHRVKAINGQRAEWALEVAKDANYVAVLTGTPIPNTYCDIYNLLHLLYPRDYTTFFGFEPALLKNPDQGTIRAINKAINPFFCRTNKDELGVPRPDSDDVETVEASKAESRLMQILAAAYRKNHLVLVIRTLQLASDARLLREAIDPADLEYVLDQTGDEIDDINFVDYSEEVPGLIELCGRSSKTEACISLVSRLVAQGRPAIVWCIFVRSIINLSESLRAIGIRAGVIYGATPIDERERILRDFRMGLLDILVTNPHTLAESVSLHQICHDGVYFEYGYNLVHLLQSKDRIHRLGLDPHQHTRYHFLQTRFNLRAGPWSLDGRIYHRLKEKEHTMLDAIDGDYLERGYLDAEDVEIVLGELFDLA